MTVDPLLLIAALLLLSVAILFYRQYTGRQRLAAIAEQLAALEAKLDLFNDSAQGVGRRLVDVEAQLHTLAVDSVQLQQKIGERGDKGNAYAQAEALLKLLMTIQWV